MAIPFVLGLCFAQERQFKTAFETAAEEMRPPQAEPTSSLKTTKQPFVLRSRPSFLGGVSKHGLATHQLAGTASSAPPVADNATFAERFALLCLHVSALRDP